MGRQYGAGLSTNYRPIPLNCSCWFRCRCRAVVMSVITVLTPLPLPLTTVVGLLPNVTAAFRPELPRLAMPLAAVATVATQDALIA